MARNFSWFYRYSGPELFCQFVSLRFRYFVFSFAEIRLNDSIIRRKTKRTWMVSFIVAVIDSGFATNFWRSRQEITPGPFLPSRLPFASPNFGEVNHRSFGWRIKIFWLFCSISEQRASVEADAERSPVRESTFPAGLPLAEPETRLHAATQHITCAQQVRAIFQLQFNAWDFPEDVPRAEGKFWNDKYRTKLPQNWFIFSVSCWIQMGKGLFRVCVKKVLVPLWSLRCFLLRVPRSIFAVLCGEWRQQSQL